MGIYRNFEIRLIDGTPELFDDGAQVTDHEFDVPAGACYLFTFKIAFDGAETLLRFKRHGDPDPSGPISWKNAHDPPPSIHPSLPTHHDKELIITVDNPSGRSEKLATSFVLNLHHPSTSIDPSQLRVDPTIVEKPDEPVPPYPSRSTS